MRKVLTMLAAVAVLSGCGGEDSAGEASAPSSSFTAEDQHDQPADEDAAALDSLCDEYCEPLIAQEHVCPTGTENLLACSIPLAEGADMVNVLAEESAELDRTDPERYEDFDARIADARDAYDTWSDHSTCSLIYDVNDPHLADLYGSEVFVCSAEAATVSYSQSSVGAVLRNLAGD